MGPHSMLAVRRARVPCAHHEVASSSPPPPPSLALARALSLYNMVPHALRARRARTRAQRVMRDLVPERRIAGRRASERAGLARPLAAAPLR